MLLKYIQNYCRPMPIVTTLHFRVILQFRRTRSICHHYFHCQDQSIIIIIPIMLLALLLKNQFKNYIYYIINRGSDILFLSNNLQYLYNYYFNLYNIRNYKYACLDFSNIIEYNFKICNYQKLDSHIVVIHIVRIIKQVLTLCLSGCFSLNFKQNKNISNCVNIVLYCTLSMYILLYDICIVYDFIFYYYYLYLINTANRIYYYYLL